MRSLLALVFTLFLTFSGASAGVETRDSGNYFFNETFGNLKEELQTAREQGKQGVMIFFEMDECPFCHWMKENVLNRADIQTYYRKHFLLFPMDIEGDVEIADFQGKLMSQKDFSFKVNRVRATPVIAFYDLGGRQIFRYTGKTSSAAEFMLMGHYIVDGAYRKMPFTKYKRQHRQ